MKKIILYIAASLDGYIARKDGSLDWLTDIPNPDQSDHGYTEFYERIDTVIMGRKTYEEILGFDVDWPYADCRSLIVSSRSDLEITTENTFLLNGDLPAQIRELKKREGKDIWLVGGGKLVTAFLNAGLIDELILSIAPVILGEGIPLFPDNPKETTWELLESKVFGTGIISLTYSKKRKTELAH